MSNETSERGKPKLVNVKDRRKLYVQWTPPGSRRSKVKSTGWEGRADAPPEGALIWLDDFISAQTAPPPRPTIGDLMDARVREAEGRVIEHKAMEGFASRIKARIGHLHPADWTPQRNARFIREHGSPSSVRRHLQELRSAFLLHSHTDQGFVAPRVKYPPERPPRERYITRQQAKRLMEAARPVYHLWLFILLARTTGRRKGAILDLTWDRVDLERGVLDFRNPERMETKKRRGVVKIAGPVVSALSQARLLARTSHVIEWAGRPVANIKRGFQTAVADAGLERWVTPHVLKHSVISWLASDDYSVDRISDMTDTDPKTVRRIYRKINPASLSDMAESLAGDLVGGGEEMIKEGQNSVN
ncbi:MAG: tyrosine-type recombinase/integrase [Dehalococcoidia bacterium]